MIIIYLISLLLALLSGWFIIWHVPYLKYQPNKHNNFSDLSIIIPARNEESNLPILLTSLAQQSINPLEILVIDDDSQDNTKEIATKFGAKVIQPTRNDNGWVGKSAACWSGAQAANGKLLLFLDSDIFLPHRESLAHILTAYEAGGDGVLSIQPYHVIKEPYENLSAIFNIMVLAGMNSFSFLQSHLKPAGAFGPSLLCQRDTYFSVGGHEIVQNSIMENVALGKVFIENDIPVRLFGGKNILHFRMYPSGVSDLGEGWSKSFASASKATHPFILIATSIWITGAILSFMFPFYFILQSQMANGVISILGYVAFSWHFYRMTRLAGNFHWLAVLLYPLLFCYFIGLFGWSLIKTYIFREVSWKGRNINM